MQENRNLFYLVLFLAFGIAFLVYFIAKPENEGINKEKERLQAVELQFIDVLAQDDTVKAKLLLVQLRWQYEPSTIGGQSETDALKKTWNTKRKEYLMLIRENPVDYSFEEDKRGLKSQWDDLINN